jgi:replication-associated recombination protein RarA
MLKRPWIVQTDPDKVDFIIATERSHCADERRVVLIDEIKRFDRTFAWVYARRAEDK